MTIKVYGTRLSPFVEKVVRGLQLKKLDYQLIEPKTPMDLAKANPTTGKMPVVEIDGERIYDSTFILRRLDELEPNPPLLSDDAMTAANQRQLEDWADEALYWYTMAFRWTERNGRRTANQILASAPAILRTLLVPLVKRKIGGMAKAQGMGRLPEDVLEREYAGRLEDLERLLGNRDFFYGDRPSVADLAVYGQLSMGDNDVTPETRQAIRARPKLVEYLKRVEQATGG